VQYTAEFDAPLERLWQFHEDVKGALPKLTPSGQTVELESAEPLPPRVGTVVILRAKMPILGWKRWVARYAEHVPPNEDGTAWFTDEQDEGPFKTWRHRHLMEALPEGRSRLTDEIDYTPPLGPLGVIGDWLIIRRQLAAMFRHRHEVTRQVVESSDMGTVAEAS
jgi:ligand-binding SRPBCC domain-containing protein